MKKTILTLLASFVFCTSLLCTHVHTEECGPDGKNCTHECLNISPFFIEPPEK